MPRVLKKSDSAKIYEAILRLSATKGWSGVTVESVAKAAKASLPALKRRFSTPYDFISFLVAHVTQRSLSSAIGGEETPKDALFEIMMARFDIYRKTAKPFCRSRKQRPEIQRWRASCRCPY